MPLIPNAGLILLSITAGYAQQPKSENSPPVVTINTPLNNSRFQWNAVIPYSIHISDQEDGNSGYNEIPNNEVLMSIAYQPDSAWVKKDASAVNTTPALQGLLLIARLNCFTCHTSRQKLIGPSFDLIARKYPITNSHVASLANKVISGSVGVWGDVPMPSHPDLDVEQAKKIVRWILEHNLNPDLYYVSGLQGSFRTKEKGGNNSEKGTYILTASYMDHGSDTSHLDAKQGQHTVVLRSE